MKFQIFLAYYTFAISSLLLLWAFIFAPKPDGFFLALLLSPVSLYFYLLVSGTFKKPPPESMETTKNLNFKFPLILMTIFFICSFAIFFYSISNQKSLSEEIASLKKSLANANQTIDSYKKSSSGAKEVKNALTTLASKEENSLSQIGTLTINSPQYQTINVYEDNSLSSSPIGKIEYGKDYTFLEKGTGWYLILLPDVEEGVIEGYISSLHVEEHK